MRSDALASEPMPSLRNPLQPARGIRHGSAARTGRAWEPVPLRTGERGFALPPGRGGNSCRPLGPAAGLLLLSRLALVLELLVLIANPEARARLASCALATPQACRVEPLFPGVWTAGRGVGERGQARASLRSPRLSPTPLLRSSASDPRLTLPADQRSDANQRGEKNGTASNCCRPRTLKTKRPRVGTRGRSRRLGEIGVADLPRAEDQPVVSMRRLPAMPRWSSHTRAQTSKLKGFACGWRGGWAMRFMAGSALEQCGEVREVAHDTPVFRAVKPSVRRA